MAWYCEHCKRSVDGSEVDVGAVHRGGRSEGSGPYHRACLEPVRVVRDESEQPARPLTHRDCGDEHQRAKGGG